MWARVYAGTYIHAQQTQNKAKRDMNDLAEHNFGKGMGGGANWLTRISRSAHDRHRSCRGKAGVSGVPRHPPYMHIHPTMHVHKKEREEKTKNSKTDSHCESAENTKEGKPK